MSMKVFRDADCNTAGACSPSTCGTDAFALEDAIDVLVPLHDAAPYGKIIVNISLGGVGTCSGPMQTAITKATAAGMLVVVAAGNNAGDVESPANCTGSVPVGATDENDNIGDFRAISGWIQLPPNLGIWVSSGRYLRAEDNWWYVDSDEFARESGKINPREDFATSFAAYFMNVAHRDFLGGEGADASPQKMNFVSSFVASLS